MKYMQSWLFAFLFFSITRRTSSQGTCTVNITDVCHITNTCNQEGNKDPDKTPLQVLVNAFNQNSRVNLVIINDRSSSIQRQQNLYECGNFLLFNMLNFLEQQHYLAFGLNKTRMALFSFAKTVTKDYDGISNDTDSEAFELCDFADILNKSRAEEEASNLGSALNYTAQLFEDNKSTTVKNILLVVTDGIETYDHVQLGLKNESIERLNNSKVERFVIGQNGDIFFEDKESQIIDIASSIHHYQCLYDWQQALSNFTEGPPESSTTHPTKDKDGSSPSPRDPLVIGLGGLLFLAATVTIVIVNICCRKQQPRHGENLPLENPGLKDDRTGYENPYEVIQSNNENGARYSVGPMTNLENDLPGWGRFLLANMNIRGFLHLSVHNMDKERWAMTPGVKVKRNEVRTIYDHFKSGLQYLKEIKLGGMFYKLQLEDCVKIVAERTDAIKGTSSIAVVMREDHYMVIGIADERHSPNLVDYCQQLVFHLQCVYGNNASRGEGY